MCNSNRVVASSKVVLGTMGNRNSKNCLNCGAVITGNYCVQCGQKGDTKRLDLVHFFKHDIVHGALHFDKGLPFTLKEIILRPGQVALQYIQGKRVIYYSFFYLVLLLVGLILLVRGIYIPKPNVISETTPYQNGYDFARGHLKAVFLLLIPLLVVCSKIVYRKQPLNIAEHSIIAVINIIYLLLFTLLSNCIYLFGQFVDVAISSDLGSTMIYLGILSFTRVYYYCFQSFYTSKLIAFIKSYLTAFLFLILLFLFVMVLIYTAN